MGVRYRNCISSSPVGIINIIKIINIIIFLHQYPVAFLVQIVILPGLDGPEQNPGDDHHENYRQRNEKEDDFHYILPSLPELMTTAMELRDIPTAAIQGATRPIAAAGKARTLYIKAHARFCLMTVVVLRA